MLFQRWMMYFVSVFLMTINAVAFSEVDLVSRVEETPFFKSMEASNEGEMARSELTKAQFQPQLEGQMNYGESKEDPLFQFSPVITVSRSSTIGIAQKLPVGVSAKIEGFSEQLNIPAFNVLRANRTGARIKMEVDLLSNFLGRRDGSDFKSAKVKQQVARLKSVLDKNKVTQDLRKLYWSYMGLEESYKIAEILQSSAEKQLQEIKARQRNGAADISDVARAEAQYAGRKTQISMISYQKTDIYQQLKSQFQELSDIPYVPTVTALKDLSECVEAARAQGDHIKFTDYAQMIDLLKEEKSYAIRQAKTTGDWDLKLQGLYQQNAVSTGFSESQDAFLNQPRDAFQVGVHLNVPLGSGARKAEKHSVLQAEHGYDARIKDLQQTIMSRHERAQKSLQLLDDAVRTQDLSVKSLRTSVESTKRKYSQARISQIEFIMEQDKLFSAEVDTIQSRLQIITEVLDYLKVFNKHQCKFNKSLGN